MGQEEIRFKNSVFVSNPEMYFELWPPEEEQYDPDLDMEFEDYIPDDPDEWESVLNELRRDGVIS